MSSKKIGVEEARKTLGPLVDAAYHHGQITILKRHRTPYAAIVPISLIPQETAMTRIDLTAAVARSIEGQTEGIDVEAIVDEISERYEIGDIDDIPAEEYWAIVKRHDATQSAPGA